MHSVIETETFITDCAAAGVNEHERFAIIEAIARNPHLGVVIPGTGGARKVRIAGRGKGKSGGYRVVTYYAADDVPAFLLALISKGERADLSQAERNALRRTLSSLAEAWRRGAAVMGRR
jgi:hypothetical protein